LKEAKGRISAHEFKFKKKLNKIFLPYFFTPPNDRVIQPPNEMASEMTTEQLIEAVLARPEDDRKTIMLALVEAMLIGGPLEAKAAGKRKAKDPSAPKREANWWIKATQHVRSLLAEQIAADNEARVADGDKKLPGTVPTTVASMLKDAGKLSADVTPSEEEVLAAYESYKAEPPAPKKASSTASSGSSAKSSKSKYAGMTPEEAEAAKKRRSEAAKKAAATRAANKAKKAAEEEDSEAILAEAEALIAAAKPAAAPKPAAPAEELEEDEIPEKQPITFKGKKYMSLPIEHHDKEMVGLWDLKGKWVGALETEGKKQTLHTDCDDPLA
jgi:hypothetical protein